jgi:hypothetical protein
MQTFLPYSDFSLAAKHLDNKRLGNQRCEAKVLIKSNLTNSGWAKHPAAKMWKGHEGALGLYGIAICNEWLSRGFKDTTLDYFSNIAANYNTEMPKWTGNEAFHASHRSNLLRKLPDFYGKFGWCESPDLPYIWPV